MNVSSRCEYACRAVIELAYHIQSQQPLTVEVIAARRFVPDKFLVQILLQLKRAGIVRSIRGAKGGYLLARLPEEITLLDIVRAIDGPVLESVPTEDVGASDLVPVWREVAGEIEAALNARTVRSILDRASRASMYFI